MLLGLASVPAAAEPARWLLPDLTSGSGPGWSAVRDGDTGSAGGAGIVLAAREFGQKPEPGRGIGGSNNNGGNNNNGNENGNAGGEGDANGTGNDEGSGIPELAARPISEAAQCDRTPVIEGQGGGSRLPSRFRSATRSWR